MLMIDNKNRAWGIAHESTSITGALFCDKLFTFKHQAEAYIDEANDCLDRQGGIGLRPVLVETVATLCSDAAAASYHADQSEWLAAKRGER